MNFEILFLKALIFTIAVETAILLLLLRTLYKSLSINTSRILMAGVISSFSTLPYLWFIIPAFIQERVPYIIISEVFAVIIESAIIYALLRINYSKSIIISFFCNLASFIGGLIIGI